jgi:hypothetical protein
MRFDETTVLTFEEYLAFRGYSTPITSPWPFFKRGFIDCWTEPGFNKFWRVWNPPFGYLTYLFYRFLGGKRYRIPATLITFMASGFAFHDSVGLIFFNHFTLRNTICFFLFGLFTLLDYYFADLLRRDSWPKLANLILNGLLVWFSFYFGTILNMRLQRF